MGNGVVTRVDRSQDDLAGTILFKQITSKLAMNKAYYFEEHENDYKLHMEEAIGGAHLDILEILIPSGDARKTLPLHMAARAATVDCVELLLSAGFDGRSKNQDDQIPLHLCAMNESMESALCVKHLQRSAIDMAIRHCTSPSSGTISRLSVLLFATTISHVAEKQAVGLRITTSSTSPINAGGHVCRSRPNFVITPSYKSSRTTVTTRERRKLDRAERKSSITIG